MPLKEVLVGSHTKRHKAPDIARRDRRNKILRLLRLAGRNVDKACGTRTTQRALLTRAGFMRKSRNHNMRNGNAIRAAVAAGAGVTNSHNRDSRQRLRKFIYCAV
ncbi:hypothetical protein RR46_08954 [Papilio xuthus]|uniref:Uncharacterized protein n=1 Tax=Papilio xuthus TaxID=66420 RepID=A0A194PWI5_PAPXU|nr:hypothetical protein RR46_08954 [Papilio xuthus]